MGALIKQIRAFTNIPYDRPELLKAQCRAFSRQLPLMYIMLLFNSWGLSVSFMGSAPVALTVVCPALLTVICVIRMLIWWRSMRGELSVAKSAKILQHASRLSTVMALLFAVWSVCLFPYGDVYAQSHVAFYMAITAICSIFCMMHLRLAAVSVGLIVNIAIIGLFGFSGNMAFTMMMFNTLFVTVTMLVILVIYYRDFTYMIEARSSARALSNENLRLANLDALTNLPNRRSFFAHLDDEFIHAKATSARLALGIVDLNGFKPVNDLYGHAVGDNLLIEVGRRLQARCFGRVHLARLGGDEFAFIISDAGSNVALLALGESICADLKAPFVFGPITIQISGAVGLAVYPDLATDVTSLFERADYALYYGKRTHRGHATLFSVDHDAQIHRDAKIEQALHTADLHAELMIFFQPIVDIETNTTLGFEALARWLSPQLGPVAPGLFIPLAERIGMINTLTRILFEKALRVASGWPGEMRLSFNLSAKDISSSEGIAYLIEIIRKSGFDPARLDLEITETAVMHDFGQARIAIESLKDLGCGISLDDFGTGFSSLSQLHALPLTKIKVDRSFVMNLHIKPASYKIVKSLLALSRDMDLGCIVEGVESEEEMQALRTMGNISVQGYYYSPPIPEGQIPGFLQRIPAFSCLEVV